MSKYDFYLNQVNGSFEKASFLVQLDILKVLEEMKDKLNYGSGTPTPLAGPPTCKAFPQSRSQSKGLNV
jgi:hypothetical protein